MTSSSRAARATPDRLDPRQRALYDAITDGPRGGDRAPFALVDGDGALRGPFAAMLLAPVVGDVVQRLGAALRFESVLDDRLREVAILTIARRMDSVFERTAHEEVARRLGMTDEELAAIRSDDHAALPARERRAVELVDALISEPVPLAADYDDEFTAEELYELTVLAGYYRMLAAQLHFFELDEPAR